jgi:signal peptidase I
MPGHEQKQIADWFDLISGLIPHGGIIELPVLSGSMAPCIMPGKNIKIMSVSSDNMQRGDIIVYKDGNTLTMHRILARIPLGCIALLYQKGDASRFGSWIRQERVVGIVTAIQDDEGKFIDITQPETKKNAKRAAYRQTILTIWNAALVIPRFIKKCINEI